eukprot:GFUD01095064.1.p1 GENE.GFUD01095064.1~~GFUD01095064.1.p1  ORF type:complete len:153 (+),score=23.78 GFUD01095064.1:23-481(+)
MGPRHLLLLATLCLQYTALDAQGVGPNHLPSMTCPTIGVDINGPECDINVDYADINGQPDYGPCNNACFQNIPSWEACASQCSGFNMKKQPNGTYKNMGYIAWSWQSRGAPGKFALQCCCKNNSTLSSKNFPYHRSSSIMGTARCLGGGRTY